MARWPKQAKKMDLAEGVPQDVLQEMLPEGWVVARQQRTESVRQRRASWIVGNWEGVVFESVSFQDVLFKAYMWETGA